MARVIQSASPASVEAVNEYWDIKQEADTLLVDATAIPRQLPSGRETIKLLAELAVRTEVLARRISALSGITDPLSEGSLSLGRDAAQQAFAAALLVVEGALPKKALKRFRDNRNNTRRRDAWGPMKRNSIAAHRAIKSGGEKTRKRLGLYRSTPTPTPAPVLPAPAGWKPDDFFVRDGKLYVLNLGAQGRGVVPPEVSALYPQQLPNEFDNRRDYFVFGKPKAEQPRFTPMVKITGPTKPVASVVTGPHWRFDGSTDTLFVESGWRWATGAVPVQYGVYQKLQGSGSRFPDMAGVYDAWGKGVTEEAPPPPTYYTPGAITVTQPTGQRPGMYVTQKPAPKRTLYTR